MVGKEGVGGGAGEAINGAIAMGLGGGCGVEAAEGMDGRGGDATKGLADAHLVALGV